MNIHERNKLRQERDDLRAQWGRYTVTGKRPPQSLLDRLEQLKKLLN